jgi:hypothetical protein
VQCELQYVLHSILKDIFISLLLRTRQMDPDRLTTLGSYVAFLTSIRAELHRSKIVLIVVHICGAMCSPGVDSPASAIDSSRLTPR